MNYPCPCAKLQRVEKIPCYQFTILSRDIYLVLRSNALLMWKLIQTWVFLGYISFRIPYHHHASGKGLHINIRYSLFVLPSTTMALIHPSCLAFIHHSTILSLQSTYGAINQHYTVPAIDGVTMFAGAQGEYHQAYRSRTMVQRNVEQSSDEIWWSASLA